MKFSLTFLSIVTLAACAVEVDKKLQACECDSPSCPAGRLDEGSLCACLNNAALFCWYRNSRACASPALRSCGAKGTGGAPSPAATPTTTKYTPPYGQGAGGLNCVEIGYCSRPSKAKTTMSVTVSGTATVITVPVGLPTPDLFDPLATILGPTPAPSSAPAPTSPEAPIVFTPLGAADPAATSPPMPRERALKEKRINENRWMG